VVKVLCNNKVDSHSGGTCTGRHGKGVTTKTKIEAVFQIITTYTAHT